MNIKRIISVLSFAVIITAFSCKTCQKKEKMNSKEANTNKYFTVSKITSQYSYPGVQGAPPVNTYKVYLKIKKNNIVFDSAYITGYKTKLMVFNSQYQFTNNYRIGDSLILQAEFADAPEPLSQEEEMNIEDFREISNKNINKGSLGYSYHINEKVGDKLIPTNSLITTDSIIKMEPIFMP